MQEAEAALISCGLRHDPDSADAAPPAHRRGDRLTMLFFCSAKERDGRVSEIPPRRALLLEQDLFRKPVTLSGHAQRHVAAIQDPIGERADWGTRREQVRRHAYLCVAVAARNRQNLRRPSSLLRPVNTRRVRTDNAPPSSRFTTKPVVSVFGECGPTGSSLARNCGPFSAAISRGQWGSTIRP
jgi:hypothetical protein